jgi:hypothetical protein
VGLGQGWIFEQPFETHPIDVGAPALAAAEEVETGLLSQRIGCRPARTFRPLG